MSILDAHPDQLLDPDLFTDPDLLDLTAFDTTAPLAPDEAPPVVKAPPVVETDTPFSLELWGPADPRTAEARLLERAVFFEAFGNTPELLAAEYGPYETSSVWAVVVDNETDLVAGCIRFICDSGLALKSFEDVGAEPWSADLDHLVARHRLAPGRMLDVATLSVHPDYRGSATAGIVSLGLYQAVCTLSAEAEMTHFVAILDAVVFKSVQKRTGAPFQFYDGVEPASYLDSPVSIPCFADVAEYRSRLCRDEPDTEAILFRGIGFESVISAPDWDRGRRLVEDATAAPVGR